MSLPLPDEIAGNFQALEKAATKVPTLGTATVIAFHSQQEECIARQKARFVADAFDLATGKKIPLRQACCLVASHVDQYPDLVTAGKRGASLLGETTAYRNYNQWAALLGKTAGSRRPNCANWATLLPQYRGSREYVRPGHPDFWSHFARLYENPNRLSMRYAYSLAAMAFTAAVASKDDIPTLAQVAHWYKNRADQKGVKIARMGEEWYRNNLAGFIRRDAPAVDECWFGDHHIFDAAIRVWDAKLTRWVAVRPWLTAWMDWGSLDFPGYVIRAVYPNRDSVERSLRLGLQRNNFVPPRHLYIDNGADYKAAGFAVEKFSDQDEVRLRTVADLIGCRVHFAIAYNARAKVIERMFGVVCGQFSKLWKSYRGSNPTQRPEQADEAWKDVETLPTLEQFTAAFEQWLNTIYRQTRSTGKILNGKSPAEARLQAGCRHDALDALVVYKAFLRDIGEREIMRGGVVRAANRYYRSDALFQLLGNVDRVRVKLDPDNIARAWLYTVDGREIGPAQEIQSLPALINGEDDPDPATIERMREEQKRQRREVRHAKAISAAHRQLTRHTNNPDAPADSIFELAPVSAAAPAPVARAKASVAKPACDDISEADIAAFEDAMRSSAADNKAAMFGSHESLTEPDTEILRQIEQEERDFLDRA